MIDTDFLDNIEWYVDEKPIIKNIRYRDTNENIDNETFENKIILNNENDYTIKFYVGDDWKLFKEKTFSGNQTLKTLFNIIYDFFFIFGLYGNVKLIFLITLIDHTILQDGSGFRNAERFRNCNRSLSDRERGHRRRRPRLRSGDLLEPDFRRHSHRRLLSFFRVQDPLPFPSAPLASAL